MFLAKLILGVKKPDRNRKQRFKNLNESFLARQGFESSSEDEELSITLPQGTKTRVENFSQTGKSLGTNSYRSTSEIENFSDKSSVDLEENLNVDDIEVSRTDLELGIEENLQNLSLYTNKDNGIAPKNNTLSRSISLNSTLKRNIAKVEKFASCPDLRELIKQGEELKKFRQFELDPSKNNLAILPYVSNTISERVNTPSPTNKVLPRKTPRGTRPNRGESKRDWSTDKYKFLYGAKSSYKNYHSWIELQRQVRDLKKTTEYSYILHESSLNIARENNNTLDKNLEKYQQICSKRKTEFATRKMATANITELSSDTNKILKRLPNISSEDPKSEIRENVEKLRMYGKRIPEKEIKNFIESLATIFDCAIREALESTKIDSIDELCDLVIKKFVLKGNYDKKLDELKKLRKRKTETYTDFGTRIIKFKNDLIKMAKYKDEDDKYEGRKTNIEDEALKVYLKALRKHLTLVFRYGDPKSIIEAREMVEKAEERFPFSDDESSDEEIKREKNTGVNWTKHSLRNNSKKCQICETTERDNQHEAFTCTKSLCAYCRTSFHVTKLCNIISEDRKIPMICKLCSSPNHTIDLCPNKKDNITYCQYCQGSNCYASRCEKMKSARTCSICGNQDHEYGTNCPINQVALRNNNPTNQIQNQGPCFDCQGPHKIAQCPHRMTQQIRPYRENKPYFRGSFNQGYQNSGGTRTFYRGGYNQMNAPKQEYNGNNHYNRGGQTYRGNPNYRGNNYNPNYRGNYGYQNSRGPRPQSDLDLQRMQTLFENWLLQNTPGNNNQNKQQKGAIPKITFPQDHPKN